MTKHSEFGQANFLSNDEKMTKLIKEKANQHSLPHPSDHMNLLLPIPPLLTRSLHHPEHESVE